MPEITARLSTALADRYKIERHLGEGGMATVYLAKDLKSTRRYGRAHVVRPVVIPCLATLLTAIFAQPLQAQCADGTPPPCDVPARPAVAPAAPPPEDERARSFLVLPFRNVRGLAEDDWLVSASLSMLADALGQWEEVSVVSEEHVYPALRRHGLTPGEVMSADRIRRVAEETGGWTAVTGEVTRLANRLRVRARAYDVASDREILRVTEEAQSEDDILDAFENIASRLLATAGLIGTDVNLRSVTTGSLDALKAYSRGLRHYNRAEMRRAREAFEEAIALDSTFAQAYLKLADSWLSFVSMEVLLDPQHPAYRHLDRAVALSGRLPPREQQFLRAMSDLYHGQFGKARQQLDGLLTKDSSDVDVLTAIAALEVWDNILVTVDGKTTLRGSLNRANRLAKTAVSLNPTIYGAYQILVRNYLTAAGWFFGVVFTSQRESASLPAHFKSGFANFFFLTPVLRDTLELMLWDPEDFLAGAHSEARQRALSIAKTWVERWLVAGPSVSDAHIWASRVYELDGSFERALSELAIADSLGVETELENLTGRRMVLLAKSRRLAEALHLADSLDNAGVFATFDLGLYEYAASAVSLYMLNGDYDEANSLIERMRNAAVELGIPINIAQEVTVSSLCALATPVPLRVDVVNAVLDNITAFPAAKSMEMCAGELIEGAFAVANDEIRAQLASKALHAADSLAVNPDRRDFAFELAIAAVQADSTDGTLLTALETFQRIVEFEPEQMDAVYQVGRTALFAKTDLDLAVRSFLLYLEHEQQPGTPSHAAAQWRLGMVYELQGMIDEARAEYEAALKLDPNFAAAEAALAKLPPK